jgi:cellulose synthase/poly-beta-1,6-N-acetylglucosamine synthase-like glycosyltransferase
MNELPLISIVVIGRNEGLRLARCFESIASMSSVGLTELIYVDSDSRDDSINVAKRAGARVISLSASRPTAAAGRNAGWQVADAPLILFLDGDTVLDRDFVARSVTEFTNPGVAVVFGNRRETNTSSLFNRILDLDWAPAKRGVSMHCGGDALIRKEVLKKVGGYDEHLIAGEEPDMCRRIRSLGFLVLHVDLPMTGHDLAISSISQYWRRAVRSGYAYAEISHRSKKTKSTFWRYESRHNIAHGLLLLTLSPGAAISAILCHSLIPILVATAIVASLATRTCVRTKTRSSSLLIRILYGIHSQLIHLPIFLGQLQFWRNYLTGRESTLIEYKRSTIDPNDEVPCFTNSSR